MSQNMIAIEFKKIKHTPALWISVLAPLFLALMVFLIYFFQGDKLIRQGMNPYDSFLSMGWNNSAFFLIPLFVVILNSMIINIEHANGGWKMLLTAPVSRLTIYLSKWGIINLVSFITHVLFVIFLLLFVYLLSWLKPDLGFADYSPDLQRFFWWGLKIFIATLALSTLQFQFSLWMKNNFKSIGIGLMGVIAGLILTNWEHINYFPYAYTGLSFSLFNTESGVLLHEYLSLAYTAVLLVIGWFFWRRKQFT
ncbi:MAG: ABC transporter permease [Bacteroidales bacterium]|nr:ABC transporter permease [Bacteroidales bacterium]MCF8326707.1 ABC transporter permease [Bacteroidales bacterium]